MARILGLDLGTNSIGWAVVDNENKQIFGTGVRIFQEGVENLGQGEREISRNATRREARSARRQHFRRKLRKKLMLELLRKNNMCPPAEDEAEMKEWFRMNPYELRKKALYEAIRLPELGRVFYHMTQRRGFQSNSRIVKEDEGKIFEGNPSEGKTGINSTKEGMSSYPTLGAYLASIDTRKERIRNRYTTRQMYIDEFEEIWEFQSKFHPELDFSLREAIGGRKLDKDKYGYTRDGVLFYQRPLRSQKYLIGKCRFEPKKHRCPVSAIPFEKFRTYQFVNTIECNGEKLTREEREKAVFFLLSKEKTPFKNIRKIINKLDSCYHFNYQDEDKIAGSQTISQLSSRKFFGEKWHQFSEEEQDKIWHILFSFDDKRLLKEYAMNHWGFDEEKARKIAGFGLKQGYAGLSRKAISNILPFLQMGFTYDIAVVLGGVKNAFGGEWNLLNEDRKELIIDHIPDIVRKSKKGGFMNDVRTFLTEQFVLDEKRLKKLYHHSVETENGEILDKLPVNTDADREIQAIRNPVVVKALFEVRKVVNGLIDEFGPFDEIRVELARDIKGSKEDRLRIRREQQENEKENDRIRGILMQHNQPVNHENILKYKLWEECQHICPYTGRQIGIEQLFSGEVQIEHILPWSRSLDDSYMNKTLCFADENRNKGDRTPYEYYTEKGTWEEVRQRALTLFKNSPEFPKRYAKFRRFTRKQLDEDFASRQLNDTRYLSREAQKYLKKVCRTVNVASGGITAKLRYMWGLDGILNPGAQKKSRDNHRHHAVDALVMASLTLHHVQQLSYWNRYRRTGTEPRFPDPWDDFRFQAKRSIEQILVSHEKKNRVVTRRMYKARKNGKEYRNLGLAARGPLHKEYIYGKRTANGEEAFHIRKPLASLDTQAQVMKIVDPVIRSLVLNRVEMLGGFKGKKVPENTYIEKNENGETQWMIHLPGKQGEQVPVKSVRIRENLGYAARLKKDINQHVNLRNNHHVMIYEDSDGNLNEQVVTFWEAVRRKTNKEPLYRLPPDGEKIHTVMEVNDLFLIGLETDDGIQNLPREQLARHLYRVQKLSSMYYTFRMHTASSIDNPEEEIRIVSFKKWKELNPVKVRLTITGHITDIDKPC